MAGAHAWLMPGSDMQSSLPECWASRWQYGARKVQVKLLSCVRLFATPWTVAHQAPPSMESSRQEYWSGLPFPSPGYLPDPGIEPRSPVLQADALPSELPGKPQINLGSDQLHLWYSVSQSVIMHVCMYGSFKRQNLWSPQFYWNQHFYAVL